MNTKEEIIIIYEQKKREIDSNPIIEIEKYINDYRSQVDTLTEIDKFAYLYSLLKIDLIDESYGMLKDCYNRFIILAKQKGDNLYYSDLEDFIDGMICGLECDYCCETCNCETCCGCCCLVLMIAVCFDACCGSSHCASWVWNDLFVGGFCEWVDSCCCEPIGC